MNWLVSFFFGACFCASTFLDGTDAEELGTEDGSLLLQPELDKINVTQFLLNDRLLKFQLRCVLFNGPCDIIGHWLKPRVKGALLGECLQCTEHQKKQMETLMEVLTNYFPEIHRAAVAKYINSQGLEISDEDQKLIDKINSDEGWAEFKVRLHKVITDMQAGKIPSIGASV